MKIGLVQATAGRDIEQNLNTVKKYVIEAEKNDCVAVCFPEAFLTGYFPKEHAELALEKGHSQIIELSPLAKQHGIDLLVGFMEKDESGDYLTHGIFRAKGEVDYYRKTHLGEREKEFFAAGDKLEVFELSCGLKIGFQLCVETHYPDVTQTLSLDGAELIFAPHAVPRAAGNRKDIWLKYIPTRSYDNRVYMACCNLWDAERFAGGCMVTDPKGNVVAEFFEEEEGLLVAEIDVANARCYREGNASQRYRYYPEKRRTELYK